MVNGSRTPFFRHKKGLRQGDPLSPMFILALEPLQRILSFVEEHSLITPVASQSAKFRVSLYADDAAIFVNPVRQEVHAIKEILNIFGEVPSLHINLNKLVAYPIRCDNIAVNDIMQDMPCTIKTFPCKYLGLPLSLRKLRRVEVQPLIDRVASKLPAWKEKLMDKAGRLTLVKSVLSAMPVYFLTVFSLPKWAIKKIDKIRRSFLWKGEENASGGHCLVNWKKCKLPKELGGLGILDLQMFSRALRLRWIWFKWKDPKRPWVGSPTPCDNIDRQVFRVSTVVTVDNGAVAKFWHCSWLQGRAPIDIAPTLYKLAWRKQGTVQQELQNNNWTHGLWRMTTA